MASDTPGCAVITDADVDTAGLAVPEVTLPVTVGGDAARWAALPKGGERGESCCGVAPDEDGSEPGTGERDGLMKGDPEREHTSTNQHQRNVT